MSHSSTLLVALGERKAECWQFRESGLAEERGQWPGWGQWGEALRSTRLGVA